MDLSSDVSFVPKIRLTRVKLMDPMAFIRCGVNWHRSGERWKSSSNNKTLVLKRFRTQSFFRLSPQSLAHLTITFLNLLKHWNAAYYS